MSEIVTYGEIMGRLAPPGVLRIPQSLPGTLDVTFAGAEANVAAGLALLGRDAAFVTALPQHAVADACLMELRRVGVDTAKVLRTPHGRFGLFFLETGANQRPSRVIYDRDGASVAVTPGSAYPWAEIFAGSRWFHVTGITPALSELAARATSMAVQAAREAGATVSCDLNFRAKLWNWRPGTAARELAQETMRGILPYVDLVIANEADVGDVLGIHAGDSDVEAGELDVARYPDVAREVIRQFPNVRQVATTLRESLSASHNNWGGVLYDGAADQAWFAPEIEGRYRPYEIRAIVDRVGGGDAFAAGLIFALLDGQPPAAAVAFAAAASCLAQSIKGDFNFSSRAEIEALVGGSVSGRVVR